MNNDCKSLGLPQTGAIEVYQPFTILFHQTLTGYHTHF